MPYIDVEQGQIKDVLYSSLVGSLMYTCTCPYQPDVLNDPNIDYKKLVHGREEGLHVLV